MSDMHTYIQQSNTLYIREKTNMFKHSYSNHISYKRKQFKLEQFSSYLLSSAYLVKSENLLKIESAFRLE